MSKSILVVDDEPNIVKMVEARLKANGYKVLTATSGTEGLQKCRQFKPDAVILDILMPDMDGSAVATAIREDPGISHIPIIFVTAVVKPQEVPKDHVIGGQYFLAKPFNGQDLVNMLQKILGQ
ncbi:MAG: response regulator [Syntrophales bacterium]|nr:response regulator [Syntrophales bacterium]